MGKRGCIWLGLSFLHFNGGMLGFYKYHCEEEVNEDVGVIVTCRRMRWGENVREGRRDRENER